MKSSGKALAVSCYGLIEHLRGNVVQFSQVVIEHDALSPSQLTALS